MDLFDFDLQSRQAATAAGRPLPRMTSAAAALPGVATEDDQPVSTSLIWAGPGGRRLHYATWDAPSQQFSLTSAGQCTDLLAGVSRTVFADRAALAAFLRLLRKGEDPASARAVAMLSVASSLPISGRAPVLTDTLSARWWMPHELDETAFLSWMRALALPDAPGLAMRRAMERLVAPAAQSTALKIARAEMRALAGAQYRSLSATCSTFQYVQEVTNLWAQVCANDPGLRERNLLDGTVCAAQITDVRQRQITARVQGPCRLKVGRKASVLEGSGSRSVGHVVVMAVSVAGQGLQLELTPSARMTVPAPQSVLHLTEERMGSGLYSVKGERRWAGRGDEQWLGRQREVPFEVALAAG